MSVTVDHEPLAAESMGYETVGHVLSHLQRDNRLVTNLLIDGLEPDLRHITAVRAKPLTGHTLYIETTDPRVMALDVLAEVEHQLGECDRLKNDAVELLQRNSAFKAMEKLSGCFSTWQVAQEAVLKIAQLLRIDLEQVTVDGRPLKDLLDEFTAQLRQIKSSLEDRDFVTLSDTLTYEATHTSAQWREALRAVREVIESL